MDIELSEDQELFVETSTRFIESSYPLTKVREGIANGFDADEAYRRQAAELGWYAMLVPEDLGGGSISGNGVEDCALIAYTRGIALQPALFVGTNIVAYALASQGTSEQKARILPLLVTGAATASWALTPPAGEFSPLFGVNAATSPGGYVLTGAKTLVEAARQADWILVTATSSDGPCQFLIEPSIEGLTIKEMVNLDLTRRFCEVVFDHAQVPASALVGTPGHAADPIDRQLEIACVLTAAESVGTMNRDFEMALQYAKDRTAFGRPIGSFQAIKHLLADTSLMLEMSKAVATAATRAVGSDAPDKAAVASMTKAFVGDCGMDLAQNCFQVFGGIGYTWEHDQHLYLRRLAVDAALYGDPAWHRERVCSLGEL